LQSVCTQEYDFSFGIPLQSVCTQEYDFSFSLIKHASKTLKINFDQQISTIYVIDEISFEFFG